ncbi:MAG: leucyl aminopeptidase family protein [Pseudomonadota bacterium]|nr:leucyl aminopeptidase family protein [Pseudomonadota bacterium]
MKNFPIIEKSKSAIPIHALYQNQYEFWLKRQPVPAKNWLSANHFKAAPGSWCLFPAEDGRIGGVACGIDVSPNIWSIANLATQLPAHTYALEGRFSAAVATQMALGWALAGYKFTRYKKNDKALPALVAPRGCDLAYVQAMAGAINWARDLINTPANDCNPQALAAEAVAFGKAHKGKVSVIKGEALLKADYPVVYAVGKASSVPPHMVDITFPRPRAPKVTLVGKGVCFDSGGLDIKSTANMKLMKKDMAGVAIMLALAKAILQAGIPVQLRLLLPIVENAVSGNAMRPLDIVRSRKGLTVEIGNTDAEGRLILCDALAEADSEKPDLLIDCSTLTGAARVALGTDVPAFFTPDDTLAQQVMAHAQAENDPLWRLPLWKPYRSHLDTQNADISNESDSAYGGAITAALYLQEFVSKTPSWLHIDMMAWNLSSRPGRPQGGEAMAVRALYALIKDRYGR